MDMQMLEAQIRDADERIAARQEEIEMQRSLISNLESNRQDTAEARRTLEQFQLSLTLYSQHRDRLALSLKT